tara:strand:+ start:290 stop:637 length:348 start_codon:yes stop_codon:yes gene_type:complete
MPDAKRNAAIYYIEDGFDPKKGLNGRRIAGQSFLKGFFDHADVDEFIALSTNNKRLEAFKKSQKTTVHPNRSKASYAARHSRCRNWARCLSLCQTIKNKLGNAYISAWKAIHFAV